MKKMRRFLTVKGFTLIELLIVITIIGILAVALLPSVLGAPARARDVARKAALNDIVSALELYSSDNQHYPATSLCLDHNNDTLQDYFQGGKPPKDPSTSGLEGFSNNGCQPGAYLYCPLDGDPAHYLVAAEMEVFGDGNISRTNVQGVNCDGSDNPPALIGKASDDSAFIIVK